MKTILTALPLIFGLAACVQQDNLTQHDREEIATVRRDIAAMRVQCAATSDLRACIYDIRKAQAEADDRASGPVGARQALFRACARPGALEAETSFYMDADAIPDRDIPNRLGKFIEDATANWARCGF